MNEHVDDLLPLYALGGLEPDERARVEAHLASCLACQAEVAQWQAVTGAIGASVRPQRPDPRVRARLLERIDSQADKRPQPQARRNAGAFVRRLAPAALALALAGLAGWNIYLTDQVNRLRQQYRAQAAAVALISSPTTEAFHLAGQGPFVTASGRAYVDPDSRNVVLIVQNLAPLEPDRTYQAWILTDEGPANAGTFSVSRSGWGMAWLTEPLIPGGNIGVSVEPEGGSEQPSEVVLLGGL